jgi:hypothetical protein
MSACKNDSTLHCGCDDGRNCPVGVQRVEWRLDADAAALLHAMTGSDSPEDATQVTLFVGHSRDDDGKMVYGLHAYESEYPEEGVVPLVEFAPNQTTDTP